MLVKSTLKLKLQKGAQREGIQQLRGNNNRNSGGRFREIRFHRLWTHISSSQKLPGHPLRLMHKDRVCPSNKMIEIEIYFDVKFANYTPPTTLKF